MFWNLQSISSLDLNICDTNEDNKPIVENFFTTISELKSLEKLSIKGWPESQAFDINCLPQLPTIKQFSVECKELSNNFAEDLSNKLPLVEVIRINSVKRLPNLLFHSLSSVETLCKAITPQKSVYYGKYLKKKLSEPGLTLLSYNCGYIINKEIDYRLAEQDRSDTNELWFLHYGTDYDIDYAYFDDNTSNYF